MIGLVNILSNGVSQRLREFMSSVINSDILAKFPKVLVTGGAGFIPLTEDEIAQQMETIHTVAVQDMVANARQL
jgi:hypothetical protein